MITTTIDDLRTAHIEGPTFGEYADDSKSIVTGGSDGDLHLYPGFYDEETESVSVGSKISCLTVLGNLVVIANDVFEVKSYSLPTLLLENVLLRFTAVVNHVHIKNDKTLIGAASSDFMIKIVNTDGSSQKTFLGHEAPVLCLYIGNDTVVSSSCDGSVRVWNLNDQICTKTLNIVPKNNTVPDYGSHFSITEESENILAIPCDKTVKLISVDTWSEKFTLEEHQAVVSIVKLSPCGKYLATAADNGEIFGWDTITGKCLAKFQHCGSKAVTSLTWNKSEKGKILFAAVEGDFGCCKLPLGQEDEPKVKDYDALLDDIEMGDDIDIDEINMDGNSDDENDNIQASSVKKQKKRAVQVDDEEDDDDDDDDIMPTLSKKRRVSNAENLLDQHAGVDNDIDDDDDNDVYADKADSDIFDGDTDVYDIDNEDNFDDNNTTLNLIKEGLIAESKPPVIEDESSVDSVISDKPAKVKPPAQYEMKLQDPFQPSSTPSHMMHSFMLWNSIGIIRCHEEDDVSYIDVEFHDASTHHALHIPNSLNYNMAAMSSTAIIFACENDDNIPSKLACTHFGSWDSNKEWDVSMPDGESIECIAVNNFYVAVATSERLLRIYTISGTQTQLFVLQGPVISMAIHEKQMIVIYHKSGGFKNCHCFGILQYRLQKNFWKFFSDSSFVTKPKEVLTWIGYSAEGTPVLNLSSGDVLLYHRQQVSWIPIANMKQHAKHKSDTYWVIGVEENQKQIRCIYCKGAKFPATLPRPMPIVIPFQMPLCESTTEKSKKEEELLKCSLTSSNIKYNTNTLRTKVEVELVDVERQQIRLLMQLFALACKSDQEFRAVEICNLMPNAESIGMAIQYASKVRRMGLAQRLTEIARKRATAEEEAEGEEDDEEEDVLSEDEAIEEDGCEESEDESLPEENSMNTMQSSGPRMAVIGRRSNPFRQSDDTKEENDSQDPQFSECSMKETSSDTGEVKHPSVSQGNPFKMSNRSASDGGSRGTGYFETLSTHSLTKKAKQKTGDNSSTITDKVSLPAKVTKKKKTATISFSTTNRKKPMESENEEKSSLVKKNEGNTGEKKKLTGFQLYLENVKGDDGDNTENIVPKAMRQWKELTEDDKTKWNEKASMQNESTKTSKILTSKEENKMVEKNDNVSNKDNSESNKVNNVQTHKEKKILKNVKPPDAKKINEVKNASRQKLAAFSFQQK